MEGLHKITVESAPSDRHQTPIRGGKRVGPIKEEYLEKQPKTFIVDRYINSKNELVQSIKKTDSDIWRVAIDSHYYWMEGEHNKSFAFTLAWFGFRRLPSGKLEVINRMSKSSVAVVHDEGCGRLYKQCRCKKIAARDVLAHMLTRVTSRLEKVDQEYCKGEVNNEIQIEENNEAATDDDVYDRFKKIMNISKNRGEKMFSGIKTYKLHGFDWRSLGKLTDMYEGKKVHWSELGGVMCYGCKPAAYKKDGTRRKVFPMSPRLNAYITQEYGEQVPQFPSNVIRIKSPLEWKPFRYSYDVTSCDKKVLPYFRRLIREIYPEDEKILLADVYMDGKWYKLPQFPSGIAVFMKHVTSAFTCALLDLASKQGRIQLQGDGVASDYPIEHPDLVSFPHQVINGFKVDNSGIRYNNGNEKLTTPIVKRYGKVLSGVQLWEFRRCIYEKYLNADNILLPHKDLRFYQRCCSMTIQELMELGKGDDSLRWLADREYNGVPSWDGLTTYNDFM